MKKRSRDHRVTNRRIKSLLHHPLLGNAMKELYMQMMLFGYVSDKTMDKYVTSMYEYDKINKSDKKYGNNKIGKQRGSRKVAPT